ncbi:MAG TPA: hypothetical protein VFJ58_01020 [Armatimonadota bacterium]|nr:hypothetical protein [Armatimonadota bacterium]
MFRQGRKDSFNEFKDFFAAESWRGAAGVDSPNLTSQGTGAMIGAPSATSRPANQFA